MMEVRAGGKARRRGFDGGTDSRTGDGWVITKGTRSGKPYVHLSADSDLNQSDCIRIVGELAAVLDRAEMARQRARRERATMGESDEEATR